MYLNEKIQCMRKYVFQKNKLFKHLIVLKCSTILKSKEKDCLLLLKTSTKLYKYNFFDLVAYFPLKNIFDRIRNRTETLVVPQQLSKSVIVCSS